MMRYLIVVGSALAGGGLLQLNTTVPSSLLSDAGRPPIEFAVLLAEASVPGGLEIKEPDDSRSKPVLYTDAAAGRRVPATQLIAAFNAAHSEYRAALMNGVVVVRPVQGNANFLDQPSPIDPPVTVTGRMGAARHIFAPLEPRLLGVILNSLGYEGENEPIILDGTGGRKVIDTLNEIVAQSPSVWQVTTRKQGDQWRVVAFGSIRKDGSGTTHSLPTQGGGRD